jgi:hypothetical protein
MILLKRANSDLRERRHARTARERRMTTRATTRELCANRRAARGANHATGLRARGRRSSPCDNGGRRGGSMKRDEALANSAGCTGDHRRPG